MKRILSAILVIVMLATMLTLPTVSASATENGAPQAYIQSTAVADGKFSVRLLGLLKEADLALESVGMNVTVAVSYGDSVTEARTASKTMTTTSVYKTVNAAGTEVDISTLHYDYAYGIVVAGLPAAEDDLVIISVQLTQNGEDCGPVYEARYNSGTLLSGFSVTPSCSVPDSTIQGGGSKNIQTIVDGKIPTLSEGKAGIATSHDTYIGKEQGDAAAKVGDPIWYALTFDKLVTITDVIYTSGYHWSNGGWFRETPTVEVLINGEWTEASVTWDKTYILGNKQGNGTSVHGAGSYETYTITLNTPTECAGVRIIGYPEMDADIDGMDTLRYYVSCAELSINVLED